MNRRNVTLRRRCAQAVPALAILLSAISVGAPSHADEAAEFSREVIAGDATIGVTWEDWGITYPAYGILDGLVSLADGSASITPDLKSLTVVAPSAAPADDGEAVLPWEEAAPVIARALALRDEVDPVLPGGDMDVIDVGDYSLLVPPALITSARSASAGLLDKLAKRRSVRRKLYAAAALRAVTLEEAQQFDETLNDDLAALRSGAVTMLGATNYVASSGLDVYKLLRIISGMKAAAAHGASTADVAAKVMQRVSASPLGKSVQALGVLAFAVDLAEGISDSRARQRLLAAAAADVLLVASLEDARRLLESEDADPAMIDGLSDAIGQLTSVSQTRLEEYAETAGDALAGSLPSLAAAVVAFVGTGGAALVVREAAELGEELIGYTREVLTVSAMATLGHVLRPRIEALVVGDEIGGSTADAYAMRELVTLHDRLGAEATATVYNMLWSERWRNSSSLAGIAKGAGLTLAEWLTADAGTQEVYRDEAAWRVRRVREGAAFAAALPQLLAELQDRYVGPPGEVAEAANDSEGTAADRIAPEWRILFSEDFESYAIGSRPAHYIIVHDGLGTSEQRIEAEGGNRHLRTAGQRSWSLHMREDFDFDLPDVLSVSWRMRVDRDQTNYSYTQPNGARYAHLASFSVKNADEFAAGISINKHETDRKIAAWCPEGDGKEFELQLGVWTEFRADVDFANGRQLRYANGELFCDTATSFVDLSGRWNSWGEAPGIRFGSGNSGTSVTRFDDIVIRAIGVDEKGETMGVLEPAAAPPVDCAGWDSDDGELMERFYRDITPEIALACLQAGADLNATLPQQFTPLHAVAALSDDPAVIAALVDAGADPNAAVGIGTTPLHTAAAFNTDPAVIAALVEAGADPNELDAFLRTALHFAAGHNENPDVVAALLAAGANPNPELTIPAATALHSAARSGDNPAVIEALLDGGVDLDARDEDGRTPLDVAREKNRPAEIIAALERAAGAAGSTDEATASGYDDVEEFAVTSETPAALSKTGEPAVDELFSDERVITKDADGAYTVFAADLDGDGDADVLSASFGDDKIAWYENLGGGTFSGQRVITADADGAASVFAADLDGDGDADALSASNGDDKIAWYENLGGGTFSGQRIITTEAAGAESVFAADLDGDGDADVLSASNEDDKIARYENLGGGEFSGQRVITTDADGAFTVFAADLDGDRDADVLSASFGDDKIAWYENLGGGEFSGQRVITTDADGAFTVFAADLDGDGDADVLSTSFGDDKIAWYENLGAGEFSNQRVITTDADRANSVFAADLDGDGDADVLSATYGDDKIAWYENLGGGAFGSERVITRDADEPFVIAADLDGDGDPDVLSASYYGDKIAWYENLASGEDRVAEAAIEPAATAAPPVDCAGWDSDDREQLEAFFTDITPEDVAACLEAGADPNARGWLERTPLHVTASFNDDPAVTKALIDAGARVSARDKYDLAPLHLGAAYGRNPAVIAALLEAGADADARDEGEQTPLNWAASSSDNPAIIAALLDAGADIGARDEFGNTPLHVAAAWNQNPAIIAALLDAGAYIGSEDNSGRTPLHDAARTNENPAIITALLDAGADPTERDDDGNTALDVAKSEDRPAGIIAPLEFVAAPPSHCAVWVSDTDRSRERFYADITAGELQACLDAGASPNARDDHGRTPLHAVARYNDDPGALIALLEAGADPYAANEWGFTPLDYTVDEHETPTALKTLLKAGADPNSHGYWGRTPLHLAVSETEKATFVTLLLEAGADPNAQDSVMKTPLHEAAQNNESPLVIAALIEAGAEIDARDNNESTPLHVAASSNENPAVIAVLLEAGTDVNARDGGENTPLHHAARQNDNLMVIAALIDAGADINARDEYGSTPLHEAAFLSENPVLIAALLEAGADINARTESERTPLHLAARWNDNPAVIAALLDAGVDANARDEDGRTPLDVARQEGRPAEIIAALEEGARSVGEAGSAAAPATQSVDCEGWISNEQERLRDFYGGITPDDVLACLRAGADPNAELPVQRYRPLHMAAAYSSNPAVITALVDAGADLNATSEFGVMPLHAAAKWNSIPDIIEALVEAGADPNAGDPIYSLTPLHSAAKFNQNPAIAQTLLDAGADPNARGRHDITPLHRAAAHNPNPEVIETLLRGGADPTAQDGAGRTPLEVAKEQGSPAEIVAVLEGAPHDCQGWMTNDEDLSRKFYENVTPDKAKDCLQAGFDPNMRGLLDATPLHVASYYTKIPEVIAVLVDAGADINARAQGGFGALHFAAMWNTSPAVIGALVDAGADPRAQNDNGRTPLDIAKKRQRPADIIAALEDAIHAAESTIVLSPMEPGGTAEVVVVGIADWLERQFGSGALRFALAAPLRAEEEGDDTVTVHFPGARLVERDGGYAYALGDIALEVTAEDDTAYEFETTLPPAVEMTTGNGRADGRITVDHSEISGVWRSDLETASRLEAEASGLRVIDERGRETAGVRALTLSSAVDRGSDRLWEGETKATLSNLRIALDRADEGMRLGSLAFAVTVEDSELEPFRVSIPSAATGDGSELEALGQTMEGFLQGRLGRMELEIALRDLISMDGGEVAHGHYLMAGFSDYSMVVMRRFVDPRER